MSKPLHTPLFHWLTEDFLNSRVYDDPYYEDCVLLCFGENKGDHGSLHSINYISHKVNDKAASASSATNIPFDAPFLKPILGRSDSFTLNKSDFPAAQQENWDKILPYHDQAHAYYLGALTFPAAIILKPYKDILSLEEYSAKARALSLYSVKTLISHLKNSINQSFIDEYKNPHSFTKFFIELLIETLRPVNVECFSTAREKIIFKEGFLPAYHKKEFSQLSLSLKGGGVNLYQVTFDMPKLFLPQNTASHDFYSCLQILLQEQVQLLYELTYDNWSERPELFRKIDRVLGTLGKQTEEIGLSINELSSILKKDYSGSGSKNSGNKENSKKTYYYFEDKVWHIRFKGRKIPIAGKYENGLLAILILLFNPNRHFLPGILDGRIKLFLKGGSAFSSSEIKSEEYTKKERAENKAKRQELEDILSSHVLSTEPSLNKQSPKVQIEYWKFKKDLLSQILNLKTSYEYTRLLEDCNQRIEELILKFDINISPIDKKDNGYRVKKSNSKKNITRAIQINIRNAFKELTEAGGGAFVKYLEDTLVLMSDRSNKQILPFIYNPEDSDDLDLQNPDWSDF